MTMYKLRDGLLVKKLDIDYFVLNREKGSIISFNETGNILWKLLENPRSITELAREIHHVFDVSLDNAEADARDFIGQLEEHDLLLRS